MMLLLALCSVVLGGLLIEHAVAVVRFRAGRRGRKELRPAPPPPRHRLKFFWDVPPQIGLLGTVLGLVQIFQGDLSAEAFGRGVGTACFTTVFGLGIALVARVAHYVFEAVLSPEVVGSPASASCSPAVVPAPEASS